MQTVADILKTQTRSALTALAVFLSGLVYCAGLVYAGVRAYSLFARTIDPSLLWLAVVGIVAAEISAVALPLALHYWTAPGLQRWAALTFYVVDLALIVANSILDAAHHSGAIVPEFFAWYGAFILPAIPAACMAGWALVWALDAAAREEDAKAAVRSATHAAVFKHMIEAAQSPDINQVVKEAAKAEAEEIVRQTLHAAPKTQTAASQTAQQDPLLPRPMSEPERIPAADPVQAEPVQQAEQPAPKPIPELAEPLRQRRNGHSKPPDPKA